MFVFVCMYIYVSCEKDGKMHFASWNTLYNVYNLLEFVVRG